ncbi:MAG: TonB-dependent receptor [Sinobacteraceae bacterium]|nr:TonB-dependent receptor [Nevskiaceae bacterium]
MAASDSEPDAAPSPQRAETPTPAAETSTDQSGQAAPTELGEVVVTARRRLERLADVPEAATVIEGSDLQARGGVTATRELLDGVAGVRFYDTGSPLNSEVSIRGSSTARATDADPSVGLFRNGVWLGGGAVGGRNYSRLDLFDVGRVEVLRGTQGALYGRDAVGGAINIVSMQPQFDDSGFLDAQYAPEVRRKQVQGVYNHAFNGQWALRLGLDYIGQNGGFFYNPDHDVYFDQQKGTDWRTQLRWRGAGWDMDLLLEHQELTTPAIMFQIVIPPTPGAFPIGYAQDPYRYPWSTAPLGEQDISGAMLVSNLDFGWGQMVSTSALRRRKTYYQYDGDGSDPATFNTFCPLGGGGSAIVTARECAILRFIGEPYDFVTVSDNTLTVSQDFHLSGSALQDRLAWLVGAEVLDQRYHFQRVTGADIPGFGQAGSRAPGRVEYTSGAGYGSLGYDFTPKFNLTAEVRGTGDHKAAQYQQFDLATGAESGGNATNFFASTSPSNFSYNTTASYKLWSQVLTYAKFGTSYRAGGFNTNLGTPGQPKPVPRSYGSENSRAWELGIKGSPAPWLYFALAGYGAHTRNLIVSTTNGCTILICGVGATTFLTNAGTADGWGVELEGKARFELFGGTLLAAVDGSRQAGSIKSGPYQGRDLPTPHWIAAANLNYRHAFIGDTRLFGNAHYAGRWGGVQEIAPLAAGAPIPPLDDYQLLDLRAGVEWRKLSVAAFVNNAGNRVYIVYQDLATTRRLSMPRLYGFELGYRW